MKNTEAAIVILVILIECGIFLGLDKREDSQRDYRDAIVVENMQLNVDSMRVRNKKYFLLSLHLNKVIDSYQSSQRAKQNDERIQALMDALND